MAERYVFVASARSEASLDAWLERLRLWLDERSGDGPELRPIDLEHAALRRPRQDVRTAFDFGDLAELRRRLAAGGLPKARVESGTAPPPPPAASAEAWARAFLAGAELPTRRAAAELRLRAVELPTTVFERRRCWVEAAPLGSSGGAGDERPAGPSDPAAAPDAPTGASGLGPLRAAFAAALELSADELADEVPLRDYGVDSLVVQRVLPEVEAAWGRPIEPTLITAHPTLRAIAEALGPPARAHLVAAPERASPPEPRPSRLARPASPGPSGGGVAAIGMACRFPGAPDLEAFWRLLDEGRCAIREVPKDRLDLDAVFDPAGGPGRSYVRSAGLMDTPDRFDAAFFGVPEDAAPALDPQQRLFLEVAWHALEDAGLAGARLAGRRVGVFVGARDGSYGARGLAESNRAATLGSLSNFIAARLSDLLDLRGPAFTVDSACSSSLLAVHLALGALERGDCELAIVGGTSVLASASPFVSLSQTRALSPDGRCWVFDARANGFAMGEGVGAVVLAPADVAERLGARAYGRVLGSAANNDGHTMGATTPNVEAQIDVVAEACRRADVSPSSLGLVEAHGTGTTIGDPIEVRALTEVFRRDSDAIGTTGIGSVKSNLGHLDTAAGVASLIKLLLALHHGRMPATLGCTTPNPRFHFERSPFTPLIEARDWTAEPDRPRRGGVSSFGFGGTNVHVVVEEAAGPAPRSEDPRSHQLLTLSARSPEALRRAVLELAEWIDARRSELRLEDVCRTLNVGRRPETHRLAVVAADLDGLVAGLREALERPTAPPVDPRRPARVGLLFPGQGAQFVGMGAELHRSEPVFRAHFDRAAETLSRALGWDVAAMCFAPTDRARFDESGVIQPTVFAVSTALAAWWASLGLRPRAVLGHSLGELSAAVSAGSLRLEDAARLVARRAQGFDALPPGGAMAAVLTSEARVAEALARLEGRVALAGVSGPENLTLAGDADALDALLAELGGTGIRHRRLPISVACHSHRVDPVVEPLRAAARAIEHHPLALDMVSACTGAPLPDSGPDADYWARQVRAPVRFDAGLRALAGLGVDRLVEVGPGRALGAMAHAVLGAAPVCLPSLIGPRDGSRVRLEAVGALFVAGAAVDPGALHEGRGHRVVDLPRTRFERRRYWIEAPGRASPPLTPAPSSTAPPAPTRTDRSLRLGPEDARAADHRVGGRAVLPATCQWLLAWGAAEGRELRGVVHRAPIFVDGPLRLELEGDGEARRLTSAPAAGAPEVHVELRLGPEARAGDRDVDALRRAAPEPGPSPESVYAGFAAAGLDYGPLFRRLQRLWRGPGLVLAELEGPRGEADTDVEAAGILDAALQCLAGLDAGGGGARLPFSVERARRSGPVPAAPIAALSPRADSTPALVRFDLWVGDRSGRGWVELEAVSLRPIAAVDAAPPPAPQVLESLWLPADDEDGGPSDHATAAWWVGPGPSADAVRASLSAAGLALAERADPRAGWILPAALDVPVRADDFGAVEAALLALIRDAAAARPDPTGQPRPVVLLARPGPLGAAVVALGSGLARELGSLRLRCRLLDRLDVLPTALARTEPALRHCEEGWTRPGLRRWAPTRPPGAGQTRDPVVVVSGGLGAFAAPVIRALVDRRGARVAILARREVSAGELSARLGLPPERTPSVHRADLADAEAVRRAVAAAEAELGPATLILHLAARTRDALASQIDADGLAEVLRPKALGLLHLRAAAPGVPILAFGALAAHVGTVGQAGYCAANGLLEGLADEDPAIRVIAWPGLAVGLADTVEVRSMLARHGQPALEADAAVQLLDTLLDDGPGRVLVTTGAPARLGLRVEDEVGPEPGAPEVAVAATPLRPRRERTAALEARLLEHVAERLAVPTEDVDPEESFLDLGLDSLRLVEMTSWIGEQGRIELFPTLLFEHPNLRALARHLVERHPEAAERLAPAPASTPAVEASRPSPPPVESAPRPQPRPEPRFEPRRAPVAGRLAGDEPIAVVGMACRLPGGVEDPDALWALLRTGRDAIREVPPGRFDTTGFPESARRGGFLDTVDGFDPLFFHLSPREAALMDPQQRLFLEVAWEALERAGHRGDGPEARTGVFVGASQLEYATLFPSGAAEAHQGTGNTLSIIANRVSYLLDLTGPSLPVDTACSSALVAAHLAVESLRRGECEAAVVGGVNLILRADGARIFDRAGMLAADGRCKAFDDRADGYVRGEGVGAVVLMPLSRAHATGAPIHALILASGIGHDGKAKVGLTAPSVSAQRRLLLETWARAAIPPSSIGLVEAHGTGTALGDPVELEALAQALSAHEVPAARVAIGSVKSSIGHLEAAAGVAGLIKLCLALERAEIPASCHLSRPTRRHDFLRSPLYLADRHRPWPGAGPRRGVVSSFGFGGANAHLVLEAPPPEPPLPYDDGPDLAVISGPDVEALRRVAAGLVAAIDARPDRRLTDLCYTLGRRRPAGDLRLAVVAADLAGLRDRLHAAATLGPEQLGPGAAFGRPRRRARLIVWIPADVTRLPSPPPGLGEGAGIEAARSVVLTLEALGLEVDGFAGDGLGAVVAAQLAGVLSAERVETISAAWGDAAARRAALASGPSHSGDGRWLDPHGAPIADPGAALQALAAETTPRFEPEAFVLTLGAEPAPVGPRREPGRSHAVWSRAHRPETRLPALLAAAYAAGHELDPQRIRAERRPRIVPLPSYPFARQRCWLDQVFGAASPAGRPPLAEGPAPRPSAARIAPNAPPALCLRWGTRPTPLPEPSGEAAEVHGDGPLAEALRAALGPGSGARRQLFVTPESPDRATLDATAARLSDVLATRPDAEIAWIGRDPLSLDGRAAEPWSAALLALTRSAGLEGGGSRAIVLEGDVPADAVLAALEHPTERLLALGTDGARALELTPLTPSAHGALPAWRTALILGGRGAIGLRLAEWLATRGVRRLILLSRSEGGLPADRRARLEGLGATVSLVSGSAAEAEPLTRLVAEADVVFHCAGVQDDARLVDTDPARRAAVLAPKIEAGLALRAAVAAAPGVRDVVLFGSAAALYGSAGQAAYAAGSAFLAALAEGPGWGGARVTAVDWGHWAEGGMRMTPQGAARLRGLGLASLSTDAALGALEALLGGGVRRAAVLAARPAADPDRARASTGIAPDGGALALLRRELEALLQVPAEALDPERSFQDYGVDSIMLAELVTRLEPHYGDAIDPSAFLEHPSPAALAAHLDARRPGGRPAATRRPAEPTPPTAPDAPGDDALLGLLERLADGRLELDAAERRLSSGGLE